MKFARALVLVGAFALAASPLTAAHATHAAPGTSYDITFDGYCDGLHLNIPSAGMPGFARTVDGDQTGCDSGGVFGQARPNGLSGHYGVTEGSEFIAIPAFSSFTVVRRNHTWVHYGYNGNNITVINQGTWTLGPPKARQLPGTVSSWAAAGAGSRASAPLSVRKVTEISFDGYCDGMHLVAPSAGLGTPRTADGYRTGCADQGLIGATTKIGKSSRKAFVVQFVEDGTWIQTTVFRNHTWVHFSIQGDTIYLLARGTWSEGPPTLKTGPSSTGFGHRRRT
jgi:hypothetical protein